MTETQSFFIDIIQLVPEGSICLIQAPSIDDYEFQQVMKPSEFPYFQQIVLTAENKQLLCELAEHKQVEEYFHSLKIRQEEDFLFEAYDGMEIGTFSKKFQLPSDFINKYKHLGCLLIQVIGKARNNSVLYRTG